MSEPLKGGFASFASGSSPFKVPTAGTGTGAGLFGNTGAAAGAAGPTTGSTGTTSAFGSFGAKPAAPGGSLFGSGATNATSAPAAGSSGLFSGFRNTATSNAPASGSTPAPVTGTGLFGARQADNSAPMPTTGSFGNLGSNLPSAPQATPTTGSTASNFFAAPPKPAEAGSTNTAPAAPSGGLFSGGLFSKKPDAPAAPTSSGATSGTPTPAVPSMPNLFGAKKDDDANQGKGTDQAIAGGLFGQPAPKPAEGGLAFSLFGQKPAEKKDTPAGSIDGEKKDAAGATNSAMLAFGAAAAAKPATGLGVQAPASTAGPSVSIPPPSMLRGKTIEEIVNKWTSDLEVHYKEFNRLAGEVAVWDRALIDNGNTIAALLEHVTLAEREQLDIEQSFKHVEEQQKELASTLEVYEKSTGEIFEGQSGGLRALDVGPADAERDRHYTLAADLNANLDDLSRSLTQMIESVNALTPSKDDRIGDGDLGRSKDDAPLEQIAQILSSHLESLQWIDGAVREVETKVVEVERRVREVQPAGGATGGRGSSSGGSTNSLNGSTRSRGFGLR